MSETVNAVCKTCNAPFSYAKRRGRPSTECDSCKSGPKPTRKRSAKEPANETTPTENEVQADAEAADATFESGTLAQHQVIDVPVPVGTPVKVPARDWNGIPVSGYKGTIISWEQDSMGPVAVIRESGGGGLRRARFSMLEVA